MSVTTLNKSEKKKNVKICKGYGKKEGICKNNTVASEKNPYCRNCAGNSFEHQVARLFSIQGYQVTHNIKVTSTQHDFFAQLQYGIAKVGILVECKWKFDENDTVDGQDVRKLLGSWEVFNKSRDYGRAEKAFLVTNAKFAPEAIEVAKMLDVELYTEYQIIKNILNFEPYLKQLVHEYERSHIKNHYIDIRTADDYSLSSEVNDFLNDMDNEAIVVLGDYGTGKTSFCNKYCADLAKKVLNGEDAPLPILIQLKDYTKAFDMEQLITNFLVNKCKIPNGNFNTFLQLLEFGYLVLIFDGFDEIARRVDYSTKYRVFTEICRFASETSKVVVTCRPNFFNHKDEYQSIFKSSPLHFEPNVKTVDFSEIRIGELNQEQIENYIYSYSDKLTAQGFEVSDFIKTIEEIHDLSDLVKRPVLLNVIVETVPKLLLEQPKTKINAASLYEKYTNFWVRREDQKGKTLIKSEQKMLFSQELAWKMYNNNLTKIHYKDLPHEIKNYFNISSTDDLDHFSHDIKTCSFLNNDDEGEYKFIHKSFMEYFAAFYIIEKLNKVKNYDIKALNYLLGNNLISMEVGFFIKDLIQVEKIPKKNISDLYENVDVVKLTNNTLNNLVSILSKTGVNISEKLSKLEDIRGTDLSYSYLENITFKNRSLLGVHFHGATLNNVKFINCELTDNIFKNASLTNVTFNRCNLEASDFSKANIKNCSFLQSILANSKIFETHIENTNFDSSELTEIQGNKFTIFKNCKNLETTIGLPYTLEQNIL
ncbi:hypothetical protein BKP35_17370 [Anaerobacillus arseniciselenatis]|uniref:NACHT domain-containing protein n=1 Tax=Anaerobacillus arseniciselenatis TaxID=85682 RepID=A0A1S2LBB8_9BACI|nr:pentapeptide repeat-containing protein [Anaerobacillus arseniciselenatis]OIJ08855.1 hypothetical protein BKP35_17370 [Anaerobacillus arseniciselenatis]